MLPLIVPGPHVVSTSVPGGTGTDNLMTNGTVSELNVTFDRPMEASTFTPGDVLQITGPTGSVTGPQSFASNSVGQTIAPATTSTSPTTTTSTLTIPSYNGTFIATKVTVEISAAFSNDSGLSIILIAPDGTQVKLFANKALSGANLVNTIFDDEAATSITAGTAPYTGTYQPAGQLSSLNGKSIEGVWQLQLINSLTGASGTLDSWSLAITPEITVTPVNEVNGLATTFTIGFPQQELSGTYTVQVGPNILDQYGDAVDTNLNAGLAVLRDQGQNNPTTTVAYNSSGVPQTIPAPSGSTPGTVSSSIVVPDSFVVQGDTTSSGISGLRVQLNLTYPYDPDLTATLYYDMGQAGQVEVPLFSGVGKGIRTANFTNTVFDDNASTPIQNGSAPFFATFNPQMPLSAFAGLNAAGTWTLVIQNATAASGGTGATGSLLSWSLSFQKPLPTSGLGEPGSDDINASFRIFTLSQTAALSSEAWTAVGPAAITGASGSGQRHRRRPVRPIGQHGLRRRASGGIWKTTDFLTTNASGPTYIPFTDFGPTSGIYINSITVFPATITPTTRSSSRPRAASPAARAARSTAGVGFLISQNGGATWSLYDSTNNVDSSGNLLPIESASRNREFIGMTA